MKKTIALTFFAVLLAAFIPLTALASHLEMPISPDGKYRYTVDENGNATLEVYLANEENVTTPTVVDGHPVVAIGDGCFGKRSDILNLVISEGVERIGKRCIYLRWDTVTPKHKPTIKLPSTLRIVDDYAFHGQEADQVIFPDGVEKLGKGVFHQAGSKEIYIPASVTEIGKYLLLAAYSHTWGTENNIFLHVEEGSYAEEYAKENRLLYKIGMPERIIEADMPQVTYENIRDTFMDTEVGYASIDVSKLPISREGIGTEAILLIIAGVVFIATLAFFAGVFLRERKGGKL